MAVKALNAHPSQGGCLKLNKSWQISFLRESGYTRLLAAYMSKFILDYCALAWYR